MNESIFQHLFIKPNVIYLAVTIAMISFGCATKNAQKIEQQKQNTETDNEFNKNVDQLADTSNVRNDDDSSNSCGAFLDRHLIQNSQGNISNFCAAFKERSAQVRTFTIMITSPTCLSCKPVMKSIENHTKYSDSTEFIVAVPNSEFDGESYSISDVIDMTREYAPSATSAMDHNANNWLSLSSDKQNPVFPLILVINRQGKGKLFQASDLENISSVNEAVIPAILEYSK